MVAWDDFSTALAVDKSNIILSSIKNSWGTYMTWQGTLPYMFIQYLFCPLTYRSYGSRLVGVELAVLFVVYILSVVIFIRTICRYVLQVNDKKKIYIICIMFLLYQLNTRNYQEVFFWYAGAMMYLTAVTAAFLFLSTIIKMYKIETYISRIKIVLLSLAGVIICMEFNIPVYICGVYFIFILDELIKFHRLSIRSLPFFACVLGALLCAIAPGNFVRHGVIDSTGVHWGKAIYDSFISATNIFIKRFQDPFGLLLLVIIFAVFLAIAKDGIKIPKAKFLTIYGALLIIISVFPNALGWSEPYDLPNRVQFVIDNWLNLYIIILLLAIAQWVNDKNVFFKNQYNATHIVLICMLACFVTLSTNNEAIINSVYVTQITNHNLIVRSRRANMDVFDYIASSDEANVVVDTNNPYLDSDIILTAEFTDYSSVFMELYASYFGKESVIVNRK